MGNVGDIVDDDSGMAILTNVPYGAITDYLPLPAGTYNLRVLLSSDGTELFNLVPITVVSDAFVACRIAAVCLEARACRVRCAALHQVLMPHWS